MRNFIQQNINLSSVLINQIYLYTKLQNYSFLSKFACLFMIFNLAFLHLILFKLYKLKLLQLDDSKHSKIIQKATKYLNIITIILLYAYLVGFILLCEYNRQLFKDCLQFLVLYPIQQHLLNYQAIFIQNKAKFITIIIEIFIIPYFIFKDINEELLFYVINKTGFLFYLFVTQIKYTQKQKIMEFPQLSNQKNSITEKESLKQDKYQQQQIQQEIIQSQYKIDFRENTNVNVVNCNGTINFCNKQNFTTNNSNYNLNSQKVNTSKFKIQIFSQTQMIKSPKSNLFDYKIFTNYKFNQILNKIINVGVFIIDSKLEIVYQNVQVQNIFQIDELNFDFLNNFYINKLSERSCRKLLRLIQEHDLQNLPNIDIIITSFNTKSIQILVFLSEINEIIQNINQNQSTFQFDIEIISFSYKNTQFINEIQLFINYMNQCGNNYQIFQFINCKKREFEIKKQISDFTLNSSIRSLQHEFGTLINVINIMTENALADPNVSLYSKNEYYRIINTNCQLLIGFLNDMRVYQQIVQGESNIEFKQFDIRKSIFEVAELFKIQLKFKNIKFIIKIQSEVQQQLCSNQQIIQQIIKNLISNSIKYTQEGLVQLIIQKHQVNNLQVIIQDTGVGMNQQDLNKLTKMTVQGYNESKISENSVGFGLGLHMCNILAQKLVQEKSQQKLFFESTLNKGFKCWFFIDDNKKKPKHKHKQRYISQRSKSNESIKNISNECISTKKLAKSFFENNQQKQQVFEDIINKKIVTLQKQQKHTFTQLNEYDLQESKDILSPFTVKARSFNYRTSYLQKKPEFEQFQFDYRITLDQIKVSDCVSNKQTAQDNEQQSLSVSQEQSINKIPISSCFSNIQNIKKILIVDDEPFNIFVLKGLFKSLGLEQFVLEAFNGEQAIQIIKDQLGMKCTRNQEMGYQVGMIFMDINMPIMNGIEATKQIREMQFVLDLNYAPAIIGYTAFCDNETKIQCLEAGMNNVLTKPSSKDCLIGVIQRYYLNQKEEE